MRTWCKSVSIERHKELHLKAKKIIDQLGFTPFDKVLVTCGAPEVPQQLLAQLKIGGVLVIPVGDLDQQQMLRIERASETDYTEEVFGNFSFVPMLEKTVR